MVNRRYLRIKVFQALYAYIQTENADKDKIEQDVFKSINKLYDLYLYMLRLILELHGVAEEIIEQNRQKRLPTPEDLNPNLKFVENEVFRIFKENEILKRLLDKGKINWKDQHDTLRKTFKAFREDEVYQQYMANPSRSLKEDKELVTYLFNEYLALNDVVHTVLEEKDIYWQDDMAAAAVTVGKTIAHLQEGDGVHSNILPDLYKDKADDQVFVKELFRKALLFRDEYETMIAAKAQNWETDRIAFLDMLLMQMALTEFEHFATVPVKVTLNEYIELAKMYSTPKSKMFINGVLDKLLAEMKDKGRIQKRGRGLVG